MAESYHIEVIAYLHGVSISKLQLSVGAAATLIEELAPDGARRRFAARAPHESESLRPSRLVVLHPAPPGGPSSGALLDRMASLRAVNHPALAAPLATGQVDGAAWVVEPAPAVGTLADRLAAGTPLTVHEAVRVLREAARALAVLHRRGLHHGAIEADLLTLDTAELRVYGFGRRTDGTVSGDLHALGSVVHHALQGDAHHGSVHHHRVRPMPAPLEQLLTSLTSDDPAERPASADAVLTALDWFPSAGQQSNHRTLLDGTTRGGRPPGQHRGAMLLAIGAVLLLLAWLLVRPR